jgi:predicted esterase
VLELPETAAEPGVVIHAARAPGARRITVALHGMCGSPVNICNVFADQVSADEHLICPRATARCDGGGASWPAVGFEQQIERAVERAEAELGDRVDAQGGRTLIGYSLGAFRALELAQHGAGKYPRVMLIGAKIYPNQKLLRENGVERLLLSAGSLDMMHDHMQQQTTRLVRGGFPARFLGLGQVGHFFTPSFAEYLPAALRWLDSE